MKNVFRYFQLLLFFVCLGCVLSYGIKVHASTNGHTQSEAVSWANSQLNQSLDYDGRYGAQCVDLIMYYCDYLGVSLGGGNANTYANKSLPSGWCYTSTPSPGDIAVDASYNPGHVAIVISVSGSRSSIVEQNYNNKNYVTTRSLNNSLFTTFIHPDFALPDTTPPTISNVKVTNISGSGYTVTCNVSDNVGVSRVRFPSWTDANGQDDIVWYQGTISNGVATCTIKTSNHGGQTNTIYLTDIWADDYAGNSTCANESNFSCLRVSVKDTPKIVKYKVAHYQENLDGTYKRVALETLTAAPGKKVSPAVKSYSGFTAPSKKSATIKSDGSTVIKYYYTRNSYKLTWDLGGGKASGSYTKGTVDFGAKITAPTSVKKSGYVFKGWSVSVPKTMPAKNLTIKAKWEASNQKEVEAFVTRFYRVFLNRKPEKEGLDYWTENLISKKMTGADVARGFVMSKEMYNRNLSNEEFVYLMYEGFFDRVPDTEGYAYWIGMLNSGYSKERVVAGFVNSQEFKNLCKKYNINPGSL